ncbi:MAG: winged helix-turn-helix domain-containing protein [Clostridium sp.]|nr:winged helix-turn-helix domain-containing protein [Clostridium sp.]
MNNETIGTWAGAVWNVLNENGALTIKQIKKETKLREKDIYAALGWLSREDKVKFEDTPDGKDVVVNLG